MSNDGFEIVGSDPGEAQSWSSTKAVGGMAIAVFASGAPVENMESGWQHPGTGPGSNEDSQSLFGLTDLTYALFEGLTIQNEGFEYSFREPAAWASSPLNHQSIWTYQLAGLSYLGDLLYATFGPSDIETFEIASGWTADEALFFAPADLSYANFDVGIPEDREDFEEEFEGQVAIGTALTITYALFDGGANSYETLGSITWVTKMVWN